ncbi:hypothetical protein N866_11965 [Actinotalea ferrariae CF5-4]|uniref:Uncharacterized protein n=1 Tax=Actinotalea ferrariae CF5-4 TaxID=948458 RepID=A0A021VLI0_9CELL|nr:hypothetical protein [Actinotalea ferrariae]EYR62089.1 hypothetical protein N866_11965 [Actinotalea ferrariae CF5-4]
MGQPPAHTTVYVRGDSSTYHVDPNCLVMAQERAARTLATCRAHQAHQSCLIACHTCATSVAATLNAVLGPVPSGERRRRPRPRLTPVTAQPTTSGSTVLTPDWYDESTDLYTPYGAPISADDIRFANASNAGWGTASYGQHHDEHLGENTDDDNDWRGAGRYLD